MTNYSYKDLTDKDVGTITGDSLVTVAALNSGDTDAKKIKVRNVAGALTEQRTVSVVTTLKNQTIRQDYIPLLFQNVMVNTGRTNVDETHFNIVQTEDSGFYMIGFVINYYCPTFHKNGNVRVLVRDYWAQEDVIEAWSSPKIEATVGTTDVVTNGIQSSKLYHVPKTYAFLGIRASSLSEPHNTVIILSSSIFYMYKVY